LELAPDEATYWRTRADLLHRLSRFDDAVADYDVAVHLDPELQYTIDARERARNRQPCDEDADDAEVE
jgi:predicted RNA polymerase sigma factor